jgi:heme-degrading monooxygenase HmoA
MAVRAVVTMSVPTGSATAFEAEWSRVAEWVRDQPGCLRQTLALGPESTYVVTSDWADAAAFEAFERSSRQDARTAVLRRLRSGVRMDVLTIVDHRESQ